MPTVKIRSNGTLTLPAKFRKKYKIQKGQAFAITDAGKGLFSLNKTREEKNKPAVKVRADGTILLSAQFRKKHEIQKGKICAIIELDDGSFFFNFATFKSDKIASLTEEFSEDNEAFIEEIVALTRAARKQFFKEKYGNVKIPPPEAKHIIG